MKHEPRSTIQELLHDTALVKEDAHLHVHGTQAVYEERNERVQHFQNTFCGRLDLGCLQTQVQQLKVLKRHFIALAYKTECVR